MQFQPSGRARFTAVALVSLMAMVVAAPLHAEQDLSGNANLDLSEDFQDKGPGPNAVEYYGLPINEDARERALSSTPATISELQRQCMYYSPFYVLLNPAGINMWADIDVITGKITAWNISGSVDRAVTTIWMDDRPHPPPGAQHTYGGFATGAWQGDTLVAHVTDMKEGILRRNGVPISDEATVTFYITRHDDLLTITGIAEDPVYLTEPFIVTRVWRYAPKGTPTPRIPTACVPQVELSSVAADAVPNYLPGKNPSVNDLTKRYHIPLDAVLGGAETMYPEYRAKIKDVYTPPAQCTSSCCGAEGLFGTPMPGQRPLSCKGGIVGDSLL